MILDINEWWVLSFQEKKKCVQPDHDVRCWTKKKNKKDSPKGVNCFYGVNTTDKFDTLMPLPIEVRMDLNHHYANLQEKHNQVFQ